MSRELIQDSLTFPEVNITPCFIDNTKYLVINFQILSQRHLGIMKKKTFKGMEIDSVTAYCHTISTIIATSIASIGSAAASLLLGDVPKVGVSFRPPGARKTAETARFGPPAGKTE